MASVAFHQVTKRFGGDVVAVDSLTLEVEDGEFVIFVGPSGCGKTTALRMAAGLEEVTSGEISIGGKLVNDRPPTDRDIAMVFQNYAEQRREPPIEHRLCACPGQELLDLVEHGHEVTSVERKRVRPGKLDVLRAWDVLGEIAPVLDSVVAIATAMDDERRHPNAGEDRADVDLGDPAVHGGRRTARDGQPRVLEPPAPEARVVGDRWGGEIEDLARQAPMVLVGSSSFSTVVSGIPIG